jgi:hypothetical protein
VDRRDDDLCASHSPRYGVGILDAASYDLDVISFQVACPLWIAGEHTYCMAVSGQQLRHLGSE